MIRYVVRYRPTKAGIPPWAVLKILDRRSVVISRHHSEGDAGLFCDIYSKRS